MKRFSRKWFSQIMVHKLLKFKLDKLKKVISYESNLDTKLSYGDVIHFLINHYEKTKQIEYPVEPKFSFSTTLKRKSFNVSTRLDRKQRFSYSLES